MPNDTTLHSPGDDSMSLTASFHRDGYQIIRQALAPEVVRDVGLFLEESLEAFRRSGSADAEEHTRSGHFPLEIRLSPQLWELPRQESLQAILRDALDTRDLFMHMPPAARFIEPGNPLAAVPAHQDVSYNQHMSDFLTVWIPFVPIDDACGGVAVFEGSQQLPELLDDLSRDVWLKPVPTDGLRRVECQPMQPGDILLLNRWIIHESMPNRSSGPRLSIDLRFFGEAAHSTKHYLDCQTWTVVPPGETGSGSMA